MTAEDWKLVGLFIYGGVLIGGAVAFLWFYAGHHFK